MLLGIGFALRESLRAHNSATQQVALAEELNALKRETHRLDSRLKETARGRIEPAPSGPVATAADESLSKAQVPSPERTAALRFESAKADARTVFGPLFHELGVSQKTITSVVERIARYESMRSAIFAEMSSAAKNSSNASPGVSVDARLAEEERRYHADLDAILGPETARRFEQFQREIPFRTQVSKLATQLYATDQPLSPAQSNQLVAVLLNSATDTNGQLTRTISRWDDVFAQAGGFLTPLQLDTLKTLREHDELWKQLNRLKAKAAREMNQAPKN
jgi:hypothetical protein